MLEGNSVPLSVARAADRLHHWIQRKSAPKCQPGERGAFSPELRETFRDLPATLSFPDHDA